MPKHAHLRGPHGLTPAELIERNRMVWGTARMEAPMDGSDITGQEPANGDAGGAGEQTPSSDVSADELMAYLQETGLTPGQIKGRLEASKKWEARAKADDKVARADYDRVVSERDQLRNGKDETPSTPDTDAIEAARQEGAQQQRERDFTETAASMLRVLLRTRGVQEDDLAEAVATTNFAAFKGDDGRLDDEKVVKHAQRLAGTAGSTWPDMGQDRDTPPRKSGLEAGREAYRSRHSK